MDVDELLDNQQTMIDMIRTHGQNMDEKCDAWEARLYRWHDAFLETAAAAKQNAGNSQDPITINLSSIDRQKFNDIVDLRDELIETGNELFKPFL